MRYLVDTDWIVDYLTGEPAALQLLPSLVAVGVAMSLITFGETYEGIYYGRDPNVAENGFLDLLRRVAVLPLDQEIMRRFARIRGELRRRGQRIGDPDVLIAATAIHHGLALITRNRRDFQRVPGLDLYPSA